MFKCNDIVECRKDVKLSNFTSGKLYRVAVDEIPYTNDIKRNVCYIFNNSGAAEFVYVDLFIKKEQSKMKELLGSLKEYTNKHKDIIYTALVVVLVDHFVFNGMFRERISKVFEGFLKKLEDKFKTE